MNFPVVPPPESKRLTLNNRSKPGITKRVVITKNTVQSPSKKSITNPLPAARVVRPKFDTDDISAYCVPVYVRDVKYEINDTNATVANA